MARQTFNPFDPFDFFLPFYWFWVDPECDASFFFHWPVNADAVIKGTSVNGICDKNNVTVEQISFRDAVSKDCTSMDLMAIQFCEENAIPG